MIKVTRTSWTTLIPDVGGSVILTFTPENGRRELPTWIPKEDG